MNIYHVILRGINQQIIFEDKHDHVQFISIMKHYKKLCGFKLYAYCLMDNHVHLLIEDADIPLDEIMKKIEVKFVRWYNRKYDRTGNLFQERYKSEPVNNTRYFQTEQLRSVRGYRCFVYRCGSCIGIVQQSPGMYGLSEYGFG